MVTKLDLYKIRTRSDSHGKFAQMYILNDSGDVYLLSVFKANPKVKSPYRWCVEIYGGENYVPMSSSRSYSRQYREGKGLPQKYARHVAALKARLKIK